MDHPGKKEIEEYSKSRNNLKPVTVLGLGPMGQALARAFLKNGHPTTIWNRTAEKAKDLVHQGAILASTLADALTKNSLIVICVLDYDAIHAILQPMIHLLKKRTLVNLTAGSPKQARETAVWASEFDFDYLDGAIITPIQTIGYPSAHILYSGTEAVYHFHKEILASLGENATYLGTDHGRAAAYDVSLLDLFWTSMTGYIHALAVAKSENIAAKDLVGYAQGIVNILPTIMTYIAEEVDAGHYPGNKSNIISAKAGMEHIIHTAQAHEIDTSVLSAAKEIAQKAVDKGHGTDGFSRLIEVVSRS